MSEQDMMGIVQMRINIEKKIIQEVEPLLLEILTHFKCHRCQECCHDPAVSDDELDAEITKMAERTQEPFSTVKQHLTKDGALDKLRSQLTNRKVLNFLYENADIVRGPAQLDKQDTSS